MSGRRFLVGLVLAAALAAPAVGLAQRDALDAAQRLYRSAAYKEALNAFDRLKANTAVTGEQALEIEQYRVLCLLALGRSAEAERAIEAIVEAQPSFEPSESVASPKIRARFRQVRQRVLPAIARAHYQRAKAAYDRKDYASAAGGFRAALQVLDDSALGSTGGELGLDDLRTLANGFLELSLSADATAGSSRPAGEVAVGTSGSEPRVYGAGAAGVIPPVAVSEDMPAWPALAGLPASWSRRGVLEVVIGESGEVVSASMRESMNAVYDNLLMAKARAWKYQPARKDGVPVRFRKLILISLE